MMNLDMAKGTHVDIIHIIVFIVVCAWVILRTESGWVLRVGVDGLLTLAEVEAIGEKTKQYALRKFHERFTIDVELVIPQIEIDIVNRAKLWVSRSWLRRREKRWLRS